MMRQSKGWILLWIVSTVATGGCASGSFWRWGGQADDVSAHVEGDPTHAYHQAASSKKANSAPFRGKAKRDENAFAQQLSLARLHERHNQSDQAAVIYRAVIKKDPQNQMAHHRLGVMAARKSDFETAHQHFQTAMRSGKASPELLNHIGYTFYLQDRLEDAETMIRRALAENPHYESAHNNLGLVLGQQGRFQESLGEFRKAVPEAKALANLAYVQLQQGDVTSATTHYHRALDLDQELRPAAEALVQLSEQQSRVASRMPATRQPTKPPKQQPVMQVSHQQPVFQLPEQARGKAQPVAKAVSNPPAHTTAKPTIQALGSTPQSTQPAPVRPASMPPREIPRALDSKPESKPVTKFITDNQQPAPISLQRAAKQESAKRPAALLGRYPKPQTPRKMELDANSLRRNDLRSETPAMRMTTPANVERKSAAKSKPARRFGEMIRVKPAQQENRGNDDLLDPVVEKDPRQENPLYPNRLRDSSRSDSKQTELRASLNRGNSSEVQQPWQRPSWQPTFAR